MRKPRDWTPWLWVLHDIVGINAAFVLAYVMRYHWQWFWSLDPSYYSDFTPYIPFAAALTGLLILAYNLEGVYERRPLRTWFDESYRLFNGTTTGIIILVFFTFFVRPLVYSRLIFLYSMVLILLILCASRLIARLVAARMRRRGKGVQRVLIVGAGEVGRMIMRNMMAHPEMGYRVVGFLDDNPDQNQSDIGPFRALGALDRLPEVIEKEAIDQVIITVPWEVHREVVGMVQACERRQVNAQIVPDFFQMSLGQVRVDHFNGIPLITVNQPRISGADYMLKRALDLTIAILGFIVLLPVVVLIAIAIKLDSPGPVLFHQTRVGRDGKLFRIHKFRSMVVDAEAVRPALAAMNEAQGALFKIRNDPRQTRVGRFLRRTSLDELPQLWNVVKGEMSLVGPRPALPDEVAAYEDWHNARLEVAPGMTGLWQVSGRSELTFDEMALLDIYYAENWSLGMDLRIILRTIPEVLFGNGAY